MLKKHVSSVSWLMFSMSLTRPIFLGFVALTFQMSSGRPPCTVLLFSCTGHLFQDFMVNMYLRHIWVDKRLAFADQMPGAGIVSLPDSKIGTGRLCFVEKFLCLRNLSPESEPTDAVLFQRSIPNRFIVTLASKEEAVWCNKLHFSETKNYTAFLCLVTSNYRKFCVTQFAVGFSCLGSFVEASKEWALLEDGGFGYSMKSCFGLVQCNNMTCSCSRHTPVN